MNNETLIANLRCIPDFPVKGINFRDVTTLFKNPACLQIMVDELYEIYKNNSEGKWYADTECMDSDSDKSFGKMLFDAFLKEITIT
jgi:hypothetical protein